MDGKRTIDDQLQSQLGGNGGSSSAAPVGAVMVVGGGIAGMQAALDLADQGFKVYLAEEKTAIGGHMAQLDKTFPTNDCAMCNISPRLVQVGRHLNIELLTGTDILRVDGVAGNFTVTVRHRPRYINVNTCVGCGDCAEVCPVSVPDQYEQGLKQRKAAYRLYMQAVPAAYAIEKKGTAPCRDACPASQRAQGYIALIAQGRYREALRVIKEDNPFPSVCGRTCHHPCENSCTRAMVDQPVGIMSLKRFVVDYALAYGREKVLPAARTRAEWIAIVGAGPAGLTAAHDLAKLGYGVTIYEALPVAGGMMRVGIPAHRLPKGVLQQDIDDILALGVNLKTNSPVKDPTVLLKQGYHAVCLATGISSDDHSLGIPGEDAEGVLSAATFLRKINLGEPVTIGHKVAVIGGGITALDAAAVARRLGAEQVYLVLDRPRGELPAYQLEVDAIEAEGIQLFERATATRILTQGDQVIGVELAKTGKGMTRDNAGRRKPTIIPESEFVIQADTVIGTVGQFSDLCILDARFNDLKVEEKTFACEIPGLFVVGGRKTGASYIVEAIKLGHGVANSIHAYLQGETLEDFENQAPPVIKFDRQEIALKVQNGEIELQPRCEPALIAMDERVTGFREVVLGLTEHQAREEAQRCLQCGVCSECLACQYVCGVNAIDHNMLAREEQIQVGSVLLAPGYQTYDAALSEEYGFGRYRNVLTALQFERLLSASGPTMGKILRPSDERVPQRIAFLQCVGSRDQDHDYCSAVCCMYATKEAILARDHYPDMEIQIFMMDMRAYSKGYLEYFNRASSRYGVKYTRCRIGNVEEDPQSHDLLLTYVSDDGLHRSERFDMVVLSVGMQISESVRALGERLGIELDQHGFCTTTQTNPLETSRAGIFAMGPFREPKDIPESVIEASGAAASSASLLADARWMLTKQQEYPDERDVADEEARIGVFVCHCGSNIAGYLDVHEVTDYARGLGNVVHAEDNLYTCSQDSMELIRQRIVEQRLNRVVVASCSPLTHAPLFQDGLRSAGLNPYLFEMANIRNQCSWVHSDNWDVATKKAKDLVRMAVARAAYLEPRTPIEQTVKRSALVVGGGAAGMTAALYLADAGYPVSLVEKEAELGGNLRKVYTSFQHNRGGQRPQDVLRSLVEKTQAHDRIQVYRGSEVIESKGFKGDFLSTIRHPDGSLNQVFHGATILATGGQEYRGPEYGYGTDTRIITQSTLEGMIETSRSGIEAVKSVAMILCVGPAEKYCSRICCSVAIKNALTIKEINPQAQVVILYRDIRTYGFKEQLYSAARKQGVIFMRYDSDHRPVVDKNSGNGLTIQSWDSSLDRTVLLRPDLVVLSMPVVPDPGTDALSRIFKVQLDADGFFQEAHVKLRPVDFASEGVFMAGLAHYPKLLDETIIQAQAAAARAARVLSSKKLLVGERIAVVDSDKCTGCLTCVRICPFEVPKIQRNLTGVGNIMGVASIEPAICQGCGSCAAECPAQAIQLMHYTDVQMQSKVQALVEPVSIKEMVVPSPAGGL